VRLPVAQLNHVELVYRPGERELAKRLFSLLGLEPTDSGGQFLSIRVAPNDEDGLNNVLYASEVTAEQLQLDQAMGPVLDGPGRMYLDRMAREPQRSSHFGIRYDDTDAYERMLRAIDEAGSNDRQLAGRVRLAGVFRPGDPGSYANTMTQSFVWTDVVAAGLLSLGQHIELQLHHL
jgi:hypothetical protein